MTKIKICGLTNLIDAQIALESGADMLGFIFYEPSPRYVSPERVREIVLTLKDSSEFRVQSSELMPKPETVNLEQGTKFVGVFVNASSEFVRETLAYCQLDLAQLHGDESPQFVQALAGRAFKAVNPRTVDEARQHCQRYILQPPDFILLDAYHPNLRGGTGHTADWPMAAQISAENQILLAGGLNSENVVEAISQVQPWGVDVSSGVEASKGKKDHQKVRDFVQAVRNL